MINRKPVRAGYVAAFLTAMIATSLFAAFTLAALTAAAEPPIPGRAIVMVDDTTAYPSNSIATPSELQQLQSQLTPLASQATTAFNNSVTAYDSSQSCYDSIRFIDSSNIVVSTAYVPSVGTPASAGTNQVIKIFSMSTSGSPVTNIHIIATFDKLQTVTPAIDWRASMTSSGSSGAWTSLTNVTCSWPATIDDTGADTPFVYSFDIPAPDPSNAFIRVLSLDDGGAGSGFYFLVYNFISINGRMGWTGTATANDGTDVDFIGGLAVEPFAE